mmetsp:Transcript_157857/g.483724  ORF Transcript_157857/g.483724 Transcript_157857/m.483724 type:complete len:111 (-) Transcript_157857:157-489(-)
MDYVAASPSSLRGAQRGPRLGPPAALLAGCRRSVVRALPRVCQLEPDTDLDNYDLNVCPDVLPAPCAVEHEVDEDVVFYDRLADPAAIEVTVHVPNIVGDACGVDVPKVA